MVNLTDFGIGSFNPEDYADDNLVYNPLGDYLMEIVDIDQRLSNAGNNMLVIRAEFADGDLIGRKHEFTLNLQHPNVDAVNIALKDLAKIDKATGAEVGSRGLPSLLKGKMRVVFVVDPKNPYQNKDGVTCYGSKVSAYKPAGAEKTETTPAAPAEAIAPASVPLTQPTPTGPEQVAGVKPWAK